VANSWPRIAQAGKPDHPSSALGVTVWQLFGWPAKQKTSDNVINIICSR
jgi:hypothetical protein